MPKTLFLTTPLYYVNAAPHIGHSYTEVAADAFARYHRAKGEPVFLLTGTDEHGQKIEQAAAAAGKKPQAFVDEVVEQFRGLWTQLNIRYDDFIRTTEPRHVGAVQAVLAKLHQEGKLKRAEYQGWYCTPDETFWTEAELGGVAAGGKPVCPACQRPLEPAKEDGWYLELRASQEWLKRYVKEHPEFVQPQSRYNELASLLEQPLPEYLCITRPRNRVGWGIEVPFSKDHVIYVWFDALLNYITVPGYPSDTARFESLWPADVHFIGKDILRHHAVYWPLMLHALGLPMPRQIFAHGWWKIGEQKMSKSLGNIVDPRVVIGQLLKGQPYAADVYRYFLLREVPFGQDGSFSEDAIFIRLNTDLANDLGNLVNRTCSMIERYRGGKIPPLPADERTLDVALGCSQFPNAIRALAATVDRAMTHLEFSVALGAIMGLVAQANQFVEQAAPWKLAKQSGDNALLDQVLAVLAEILRVVSIQLDPFMPSVAQAIWTQVGYEGDRCLADAAVWGRMAGRQIGEHPVLFPKADAKAAPA